MAKGTTLVAPNGQRTTVTTPEAVNNLVYGAGYRFLKDVQAEERADQERREAEEAARPQAEPPRQQTVGNQSREIGPDSAGKMPDKK